MKNYLIVLTIIFLVMTILTFIILKFPIKSNTSIINRFPKGLYSVTDPDTCCQYLGLSNGGLTPRLDPDGAHICNCEKE